MDPKDSAFPIDNDLQWKINNVSSKLGLEKQKFSIDRDELVVLGEDQIARLDNLRTIILSSLGTVFFIIIVGLPIIFNLEKNTHKELYIGILLTVSLSIGIGLLIAIAVKKRKIIHVISEIKETYARISNFYSFIHNLFTESTFELQDTTTKEIEAYYDLVPLLYVISEKKIYSELHKFSLMRILDDNFSKKFSIMLNDQSTEDIKEQFDAIQHYELLHDEIKSEIEYYIHKY